MNRRTGLAVLVSIVGVALSSCQAILPSPTPTATPAPTDTTVPTDTATPNPTDTPIPTETSTPIPTPTPNPTATAIAEATQAVADTVAAIDKELKKYGLSTKTGYLGWVHDPITVKTDNYLGQTARTDYDDLVAEDFVFQTDMKWETSSGLAGCGLVFRSGPDFDNDSRYDLIMLRLLNLPLWGVRLWEHSSRPKGLETTSRNEALALHDKQGSTNQIIFIVEGDKFTLYANGEKVGSVTDKTRKEGHIAFLAFQESGETTCTFENSWLWVLK